MFYVIQIKIPHDSYYLIVVSMLIFVYLLPLMLRFFSMGNNCTAFKSVPVLECIPSMSIAWHLQDLGVHLSSWCSQHWHQSSLIFTLTSLADVCICILWSHRLCYSLSMSVSWFHKMFHSLMPACCQYAGEFCQKHV